MCIFLADHGFDQPFPSHDFEEPGDFGAAGLGIDVIFIQQFRANLALCDRLLEKPPNIRGDMLHSKAAPIANVQCDDVVPDIGMKSLR